MTKPTVYLETSVIGYATSRIRRDLIVAARQEITREWFLVHAHKYSLFISQLVVAEASAGDPQAVLERSEFMHGIPHLRINEAAIDLANSLIRNNVLPQKSSDDALHVAVACVHSVDYLLTWNFAHIANAMRRRVMEGICRESGCEPTTICTPEELQSVEPF